MKFESPTFEFHGDINPSTRGSRHPLPNLPTACLARAQGIGTGVHRIPPQYPRMGVRARAANQHSHRPVGRSRAREHIALLRSITQHYQRRRNGLPLHHGRAVKRTDPGQPNPSPAGTSAHGACRWADAM